MPRMPVAPVAAPQGAFCSACGILPPVITCGHCWSRQLLILQGTTQYAAMPQLGPRQSVGQPIEAPAAATHSMLKKPFAAFMEKFAAEFGTGLGQPIGGSY